MPIKRTVELLNGNTQLLSDEELVQRYLKGRPNYGEEYAKVAIDNIARRAAEILLAIDREKVLSICEEDYGK